MASIRMGASFRLPGGSHGGAGGRKRLSPSGRRADSRSEGRRREGSLTRIVIHAGPPKTATTHLQLAFAAGRARLARQGWLYPRVAPGPFRRATPGQHALSARDVPLAEDPDALRRLGEVGGQAAGLGLDLLLSAERFAHWTPSELRRLVFALGGREAEILFAIRDPREVLVSNWAEGVKHGLPDDLPTHVLRQLAMGRRSLTLRPWQRARGWIVTPGLRVRAIPFATATAAPGGLLRHVCEDVLGVAPLPAPPDRGANRRLPQAVTDALRAAILLDAGGAKHPDGPAFYARARRTLARGGADALARIVEGDGATARRRVALPGRVIGTPKDEAHMRATLDGLWTMPPGEAPLFGEGDLPLEWYDAAALLSLPRPREAIEALRLGRPL